MIRCRGCPLIVLLALFSLAACSGEDDARPVPSSGASVSAATSTTLNFYNWEEYILPELIQEFETATGIHVNLRTYRDEDDILAAVQSGQRNVDLMVVSDSVVLELQRARLLRELDSALIPNLSYARAHPSYFKSPGDELLSVPYMAGWSGVIVNTRHVTEKEATWNVLWNPAYQGRIAMLDNSLEVLGAGFKALGYGLNSEDPAEMRTVRAKLLAQQPLLAGYLNAVAIIDGMVSGELWAAQLYNGDAFEAMQENPALRFFIPVEGAAFWIDCLVVPRSAPHPDAAMRFINFLQTPSVMARNARFLCYQPVNLPALDLLPEDFRNAPEVFPPRDALARCERNAILSPEAMRERLAVWAQLQAAE
ncbi:MAG: PotD/PotF family extracellular solute-binding protein [Desulfovibrio sp.]